jgi:Tfp pilus assembly protein FimT
MRCKISARGITLVEVMAVLTIATLLGAVGVPLFGSLLQRYRLSTTVNDFLSAIHFTRAEALRRGGPVQLIPADGVHWSSGWIVLRDLNDNQRGPGRRNHCPLWTCTVGTCHHQRLWQCKGALPGLQRQRANESGEWRRRALWPLPHCVQCRAATYRDQRAWPRPRLHRRRRRRHDLLE